MEGIDLGANQSVTLHLAGRGNRNRLVKWRCNYGPVRYGTVLLFELVLKFLDEIFRPIVGQVKT